MGAGGFSEPNGWLREYLDSNFGSIQSEIHVLKQDLGDLRDRLARLEGSHQESRRWAQILRDWASPIITAIIGAWAILRGHNP